jgi:hypothetical protein
MPKFVDGWNRSVGVIASRSRAYKVCTAVCVSNVHVGLENVGTVLTIMATAAVIVPMVADDQANSFFTICSG